MRIEAHNISVRLGGAPVLSGVSLALEPGAFVGLIGPNGAGKSTLLRTLAGLEAPVQGSIAYDGAAAQTIGRRERARRLSFLAQGGEVHWRMTVADVVALGRLPHQRGFSGPSPADAAAVAAALAAADIGHLAHRTMDALSGGERMRVRFARALAVEADALLADEPTAALDPGHQIEIMERLAAESRKGRTVVAVSHDLTLAARFCDRLVIMAAGRIVADGAPQAVLSDDCAAAVYGITLARGRHGEQAFVVPWSRLTPAAPARPEPQQGAR
ncbi:ABC transporter ATP-binding protein [Pseudoxanthobacter sp.]|uniref:ABC transporter ATP-binding protein n=1 Tax=Pseudoxanthobacter sp. TaxID=1925742 RepID=UPI002FE0FAA6